MTAPAATPVKTMGQVLEVIADEPPFASDKFSGRSMGIKIAPARPAWMVNQIFRFWGHQWIYDFDEVRMVAVAAGFSHDAVMECLFRQGLVPEVFSLDSPLRSDESLYVEIRRTF